MTTKQFNTLMKIYRADKVTRIDIYTTVATFDCDTGTLRTYEDETIVAFERYDDGLTMAIPVEEIKATVVTYVNY